MENYLVAFIWLNIGIGILLTVLTIPLLMSKIPPNRWYGFRMPKTLSDKEIWYKSNCYLARDFLVLGIIHVLCGIIFMFFESNNLNAWLCLIGLISISSAGPPIIVVRGLLYLRKL